MGCQDGLAGKVASHQEHDSQNLIPGNHVM